MKTILKIALCILVFTSCTKTDLTKPETINFSELKEYVLPPKSNTTPINLSYFNDNTTLCRGCPPPPPYCLSEPTKCGLFDTLVFNGSNKINIVFIAEGYFSGAYGSPDGFYDYNKRVDSLINGLFTYEPFASNQNKFNFFTYRTLSIEGGISVYSHSTNNEVEDIRDTYWNVFRNYAGLPRYTHLPDDDRDRLYKDLVKAPNGYLKNKTVYPVIVVNEGVFAGSGEFPKMYGNKQKMSITILTKSEEAPYNGLMIKLFIHEFGHSFGDLDDEYEDSTFAELAPIYDPIVWNYSDRDNVTDDDINNRKWDFLSNSQYIQGARYVNNKYRSTEANMMRYINTQFSELNKILIEQRINN